MELYSAPDGLGGYFLIWANDEEDLYEQLKEMDMEQHFDEREHIELTEPERGVLVHILDCDW